MPQDVLSKPQKIQEIITQKPSIITASYLPEKVVTNEDIIAMGLNTTSYALKRSLGVVERRAAAPNETGADMMANVAKQILEKANLSPNDIDLIICSSDIGDAAIPDSATAVQAKIGAICPTLYLSMACAGFVAGIDVALNYLASGSKKRILVLACALIGSRLLFRDLKNRALFGDGAGGMLLELHNRGRFLSSGLWTDGKYYSKIYAPYPWSTIPDDIPTEYKDSFYMYHDPRLFFEVMEHSYSTPFIKSLLAKAAVMIDDVDHFILHYPSKPLYEYFLKVSQIPRKKVFHKFEQYGNLVAAEIPIFLDEAINTGIVKEGDIIFCLTYSAGFSAGGFVMQY